jgi:AcrR family transcriptional regulator
VQKNPQPGRPRSEKARTAILDAVRETLLASGYSGLTMEAVASRAGISKATIYRWWPTRGALALEAAGGQIAIGTVPATDDPLADVESAIYQLNETFSRPLASVVIFAAIATGADDPEMAARFRAEYVYPWRVTAAEAIRRATGGEDDEAVQFLLDVIVGTVFQRTLVLKEPNTADLKWRLMALIFR